jgi:hypothetical protein
MKTQDLSNIKLPDSPGESSETKNQKSSTMGSDGGAMMDSTINA